MIKVAADTNVYISAILFGGKPEEIRESAREGEVELLISETILAEIAGVLKRKFDWSDWQISEVIKDIRAITYPHYPPPLPSLSLKKMSLIIGSWNVPQKERPNTSSQGTSIIFSL